MILQEKKCDVCGKIVRNDQPEYLSFGILTTWVGQRYDICLWCQKKIGVVPPDENATL
jgi:hypothetical protein